MKRIRLTLASIAGAAMLVACGGGGDGNQAPAVQYSKMVVFGDSLSDVGTYATAGMKTLAGSNYVGKYTVNATNGTSLNWTEILADQLKVARPCPAVKGLNASNKLIDGVTTDNILIGTLKAGIIASGIPDPTATTYATLFANNLASMAATPASQSGCFSYAQGGSRVTDAIGPFNTALRASSTPATHVQGNLGQLTVPVATQIANHLAAVGNQFSPDDLVVVAAGANDMFMNLGWISTYQTQYTTANPPVFSSPPTTAEQAAYAAQVKQAVQAYVTSMDMTLKDATTRQPNGLSGAMAKAAGELAAYIKLNVLGKGAKRVVVVNIPDASTSPYIISQGVDARTATSQLVITFNTALAQALAGTEGVLLIDAYTESQKQFNDPSAYGLSNVTASACNTNPGLTNMSFSSLMCTENNLNTAAGATASNYNTFLFADGNHPTPYGYKLLAQLVAGKMVIQGWL